MLSDSCTVQVEGGEGGVIHIIHGVYYMNNHHDNRNNFRLDLSLALLVGMLIVFYLISIFFK